MTQAKLIGGKNDIRELKSRLVEAGCFRSARFHPDDARIERPVHELLDHREHVIGLARRAMRTFRGRDMNIRPQFLACIFGITFLSGCGTLQLIELGVRVGLGVAELGVYAVEAVTERATEETAPSSIKQPSIKQPVRVVSSSGERLTPDFTDAAEEKYIVSEKTIACNGSVFLNKANGGEDPLVCNKDLMGSVRIFHKLSVMYISVEIEPKLAPEAVKLHTENPVEVKFRCRGYYDTSKGRVDPFLIDCGNDGKAAVSPVEGGEYPSEFKVWIHPPSIMSDAPNARMDGAWAKLQRREQQEREMKTLTYQGDSKATYEYASRINDKAEAWKFNCLAANQNHPDAQGLVADYYRLGRDPVERDVLRAYVWYRLAELNGYEDGRKDKHIKTETGWKCCTAKPYSEVLAANMTPSELADGERLVSKWKPNPAECEREAKLAAD